MSVLPLIGPRRKRPSRVGSGAATAEAIELRRLVQRFIRTFGLLSSDQTPCGKPLSVSHAHALMVLAERSREPRKVTQRELGNVLGIDKSNVTRLCARMEQAGHVTQERAPLDGRSRLLSLTRSGARLAEGVERSSQLRFHQLIEVLDPDVRQSVLSALDQLNGAVSRVLEPRSARAHRRTRGAI